MFDLLAQDNCNICTVTVDENLSFFQLMVAKNKVNIEKSARKLGENPESKRIKK